MIIGHDLIVKIVLADYFKRDVLECDDAVVTTKESGIFIRKNNHTKFEIQEVVMQTSNIFPVRESIIDIIEGYSMEQEFCMTRLY